MSVFLHSAHPPILHQDIKLFVFTIALILAAFVHDYSANILMGFVLNLATWVSQWNFHTFRGVQCIARSERCSP